MVEPRKVLLPFEYFSHSMPIFIQKRQLNAIFISSARFTPLVFKHSINTTLHLEVDALKRKLDNIDAKRLMRYKNETYKIASFHSGHPVTRAEAKINDINNMCNGILLEGRFEDNSIRFLDLCFAPGAFEYYFKRLADMHKSLTYGFGVTITKGLPYNHEFIKNSDYFNFTYVTGDITDLYCMDNVIKFQKNVPYVILADGGMDVSRNYNLQEHMSFMMIFAECIIALSTLRKDGSFLCKFFDISHESTISLIFFVSVYFEGIKLMKPVHSRAINSEKYILFYRFKGCSEDILQKLKSIFAITKRSPNQFLKLSIRPTGQFMNWLENCCKVLLENQKIHLENCIRLIGSTVKEG